MEDRFLQIRAVNDKDSYRDAKIILDVTCSHHRWLVHLHEPAKGDEVITSWTQDALEEPRISRLQTFEAALHAAI